MKIIRFKTGGEEFLFECHEEIYKKNHTKIIHRGCFTENAPASLVPGREYCLKVYEINMEEMRKDKTAHVREYRDLFTFHGKYLRQILCYDDEAACVLEMLAKQQYTDDVHRCLVIEPLYMKIRPDELSVSDRVRIMKQILAGLTELRHRQNGSHCAHRDLKLDNIMLESDNSGFPHVRIIDFASLKQMNRAEGVSGDTSDHTGLGMRSPSNTVPEFVMEEFAHANPEAADVFAIGSIIAELFRLFPVQANFSPNPVFRWIVQGTSVDRKTMAERYRAVMKKNYTTDPSKRSWLEEELKLPEPDPMFAESGLVELFRRCIALNPAKRPAPDDVRKELRQIEKRFFDVIMIERTGLDSDRKAAVADSMKAYGIPGTDAAHALYVYHSLTAANCSETAVENITLIRGGWERAGNIRTMEDSALEEAVSHEFSGLGVCFHKLRRDLAAIGHYRDEDSGEIRIFGGNIAVYPRNVPEIEKITTVGGADCRELISRLPMPLSIRMFCDDAGTPPDGITVLPLRPASTEEVPAPVPAPPPAPVPELRFLHEKNTPFIRTPDHRRMFVILE